MLILQKVKNLIPMQYRPMRWLRTFLRYKRASTEWRTLLQSNAPGRFHSVDLGPVSSPEVLTRTALMNPEELKFKQLRHVYLGNGMTIMADFLRSAIAAGLRLGDAQAAFELGCGGARLIRHLRSIKGLRLVGSDLIEENIKWCRENLSGIEFYTNQLEPPLKFADDETFDFVFAFSVFTHIPIPLQLPWIQEIARILKPGGVAVVTVSSFDKAKKQMNEEEYEQFRNEGTFTMDPDHPRVSFSSASIGSWDVFMTPDYIRDLYSQALEVVGQGSGGQAMVTLRKPAR